MMRTCAGSCRRRRTGSPPLPAPIVACSSAATPGQIELAGYLAEVCADLDASLDRCRFEPLLTEPMLVPTNRAVSIAIVLTELVTNAAKHAYAEGAAGAIRVRLEADGAGGLSLLVADDGPGLPTGFSAADSRGLGMRIALALTQQLGGRLETGGSGAGAEFALVLPIHPNGHDPLAPEIHRMPDLRDLQPAVRTLAMPADTNPSGDIFGGWLLAQMDIAAGTIAFTRASGRVATVAVDALTFHQPVLVGDIVSCYADVVRVGRTSMTLHVEAWARRGHTGEEFKVTEAKFTCVAIDEHRKPRAVPAA